MTLAWLDKIFPFVVLAYGLLVTAVLHSPLSDLAEVRLPERVVAPLKARRGFALWCLGIGALWSMQTLWL